MYEVSMWNKGVYYGNVEHKIGMWLSERMWITQSLQIPWASPISHGFFDFFKSLWMTFSEAIIFQGKVNSHTLFFFLVLIPFRSSGPITLWNSKQDLYGKQNYKHCLIYICLVLGNIHKSKYNECRTRERKTQLLISLSFSLCVHLSEPLYLWMNLSS